MTTPNQSNTDLVAEAVRLTFSSMSPTDQKAIQSAILRVQRKIIAAQIRDLKESSFNDETLLNPRMDD